MVNEKYWNLNGYGYRGVDSKEALGKYADDFLDKVKIGEENPIIIKRISKKVFDSYTKS